MTQFIILCLLVCGFHSVWAGPATQKNVKRKTTVQKKSAPQPAISQPSSTELTPPPPPPESSGGGRWNISLVYNSADQAKYGGTVTVLTGPVRFAVTDQTTAQFGLGAGYTYLKSGGFGYSGDFIYEMPRASKGMKGTAGNNTVEGRFEGDISLATLNAVGNYSFTDNLFIFAGVNYPFAFVSDSRAQFSGLIGYQGGLGYAITENIFAELSYKLTAITGKIESNGMSFEVKEGNFSGALLQLRYNFR